MTQTIQFTGAGLVFTTYGSDALAREKAHHDQTQASLVAQRAAATRARNERDRIKKRAAAGVCPCCGRTFQQLARHMANKHPDFVEAQP